MADYEVREAKDGKSFYYVVKGENGEVMSTSELYPTKAHAERAVEDAKAEGDA